MTNFDVEKDAKKRKSTRQCECCGLVTLVLCGLGIVIGLIVYFVLNQPGDSEFRDVVIDQYPVSSEYAADNGLKWLQQQQSGNMQYPLRTSADVVLAIRLGRMREYQSHDCEFKLAAKAMEIELMIEEMKTSPPADVISWRTELLSKYIVALRAACMDPTNFHGMNLLDKLSSYYTAYMSFYQSQRIAMAWYALAYCTSGMGGNLMPAQVQVLGNNSGTYNFGVEEASMIAMALSCLNQYNASRIAAENYILGSRMMDYSYGDLRTTGLAVQALTRSGRPVNETRVDESIYYMSKGIQANNGMYPSVGAASAIMPALSMHSYVNIQGICPTYMSTPAPTGGAIQVKIMVKGGVLNNTVNKDFQVVITQGQSLYQAMTNLATTDTSFTFVSATTSNGQKLYTILGLTVDVNANQYWKVSKMENGSYMDKTSTSVSFILPSNNDEFMFEATTWPVAG